MNTTNTAIFGGGCFWCLEAVFQRLTGVSRVVSGYMGGSLPGPSYAQVCSGETGHAEVVSIDFDSGKIRYQQLLDVFFEIHDPTTLNRQGNDVGTQYRSVIFALDTEQARLAQEAIRAREPNGFFGKKIVTELVDLSSTGPGSSVATTFYPAEEEHQNYYATHPYQGYCAFVVAPKLEKAQKTFKALIAQ